jgi:CubicO group peptidase (beta-lactamase class C family)
LEELMSTPLKRAALLAALMLVVLAPWTAGQRAGLPQPAADELTAFITTEQARAKVPGLAVAIALGNQPVYARGFGMADLENHLAATEQTEFRTASLAKPMTATAVMELVEQKKIDLDAPIQQYCPAFPQKAWPVTARLILEHQSGIRHYKKSGESTGTTNYFSIQDSLAQFKNDPLEFEPGTKYLYSTFAYSVLGCAIEGASGVSYEEYMRDHVWQPAGMDRTRLDRIWDVIPDRARGYQLLTAEVFATLPPAAQRFARVGGIYNAALHDTSMKIPGGGLLSTAEDLVRFGIALQTDRLVSPATREAMWTETKTASGESANVGLGWGVQPPQDGYRRISHSGNQAGASSGIVIIPEAGLTLAVMTNLEDAQIATFTHGITDILKKYQVPK